METVPGHFHSLFSSIMIIILNQWLSCVSLRWNGNPILPHGLIYEGVSETPLKVSVAHTAQ